MYLNVKRTVTFLNVLISKISLTHTNINYVCNGSNVLVHTLGDT